MDNDKFQDMVMEQLADLVAGVNRLENYVVKTEGNIDNMQGKLARLEGQFDKLKVRVEHDFNEKIRSLYDSRDGQGQHLIDILHSLNRVEAKLDTLDRETLHIRRIK